MSDSFNRVVLNADGTEVGKQVVNEYYGEDEQGSRDGGFRNQGALTTAVSDERYQTDANYRAEVQRLVSKTDEEVMVGKQKPYDGSSIEAMEVETDWLVSQMARPEYKTSALFRRQVAEHIARSQSNVRLQRGSQTGCHRVMLSIDSSVDPMSKDR